jgi:broad specificity phosphatase PhoE
MRKLILVKHARPRVVDHLPSHEWVLSEEGRAACGPLAEAVGRHEPGVIVASEEPKARQTGELLAGALAAPFESAAGLEEHDRSNVPMMPSREFLSLLALFFKEPRRLVLGRETAEQAEERFVAAIDSLLGRFPEKNIAVVTHGTVLSLFAARHGVGDPFLLYRKLGLPSVIIFGLPDYQVIEQVERI